MEVVWPLHRSHYLTIPPDEDYDYLRPYRTCNAILLDSPFAERESITTEYQAPRIELRDYVIVGTLRVTDEWQSLRELSEAIGLEGSMASLAKALKTAVDYGLIVRRSMPVSVNGKMLHRWFYAKRVSSEAQPETER